jgi:hypothetical protein
MDRIAFPSPTVDRPLKYRDRSENHFPIDEYIPSFMACSAFPVLPGFGP